MITLQWQEPQKAGPDGKYWELVNMATGRRVAYASTKNDEAHGQIDGGLRMYTAEGIHRLRQDIAKEVDKMSIGLFQDDSVMFLPSKSYRMFEAEKPVVRILDLTPSWTGILDTLLLLYTSGNADGRKAASEELGRMAKLADLYVASTKKA